MYKPVEPITNFATQEQKTNKFWEDNKIFEKSVDSRSEDNLYVFYDGPPFISGLPIQGTFLCQLLKT